MTIAASPIDPITGILEAFKSNDVVAICDGGHGCEQAYAFRISLIRDPRFACIVNDIVVESGNSLYQEMMDRFVAGEDVPENQLRQAWQNTTQPHDVWDRPVFEGLFREVRDVNASLPKDRQIRVLLGDLPIDWSKIKNAEEFDEASRAVGDRNSCAVEIIQREVLARQRRALVVYGGMHLLRKNLYWQTTNQEKAEQRFNPLPNSIVSLLESQGVKVYSVWVPVFVDPATLQPDVNSWPTPSLADIRRTPLGEASFRSYYPHAMFIEHDDVIVEIYVDPIRSPVMQEQFDAILYLGSPSGLTWSQLSPALSSDPEYIKMRSDRLAWASFGGGR
ncbi:hypothetical protein B0G75_10326 [Paraburkholderia sp. BL18I3N2]|uniref:hypothetical protein n=1 Tax=Paraburkholderia sp. BL18I3N2 TaxID=1938799 RepID=UPI000D05BE8C|nr:hypothetical protein [Paraburkholderia sp. BL18I3N2]PRX32800.1 hypothetical protein B0G75_10326 [Paraburkholderia sp. BL18I3N2]